MSRIEWTDAEREATSAAAEDALFRMHGVTSSCDGEGEARIILDALAPFVADRERAAAVKALRDAAGLFNPVTGSPLSPGGVALRLHHVANRVEAGLSLRRWVEAGEQP